MGAKALCWGSPLPSLFSLSLPLTFPTLSVHFLRCRICDERANGCLCVSPEQSSTSHRGTIRGRLFLFPTYFRLTMANNDFVPLLVALSLLPLQLFYLKLTSLVSWPLTPFLCKVIPDIHPSCSSCSPSPFPPTNLKYWICCLFNP